jgi:AMMECR1 domain-containing protein
MSSLSKPGIISKAFRLPTKIISLLIVAAILTVPAISQSKSYPTVRDNARLTDPDAQKYILALARDAFDTYSQTHEIIETPKQVPSFLESRSGVFVSTMRNGAPRTCMGTLYPMQDNLADEVIQNAVASAGRDRRFPVVRPTELKTLNLIVSIVVSPRPISESQAENLNPASDGLAVQCGEKYGVVLSGETPYVKNMIQWGKIRAGAKPGDNVSYFELHDIRFMESQFND